jgi:hypothetical protein
LLVNSKDDTLDILDPITLLQKIPNKSFYEASSLLTWKKYNEISCGIICDNHFLILASKDKNIFKLEVNNIEKQLGKYLSKDIVNTICEIGEEYLIFGE